MEDPEHITLRGQISPGGRLQTQGRAALYQLVVGQKQPRIEAAAVVAFKTLQPEAVLLEIGLALAALDLPDLGDVGLLNAVFPDALDLQENRLDQGLDLFGGTTEADRELVTPGGPPRQRAGDSGAVGVAKVSRAPRRLLTPQP